MKTKHTIIALLILFSGLTSSAQYIPLFSDYLFNGSLYNPAYVGTEDHLSVTASARRNWMNMPGAPGMEVLTLNIPFAGKSMGTGLAVTNDFLGIASTQSLAVPYAFQINFKRTVLSFGISPSFSYENHSYTKLSNVDPADISFMKDEQYYYFNVGAGIYFYSNHFYLGVAVPKLLVNKEHYSVLIDPQPQSYILSTGFSFDLGEKIKFRPGGLVHYIAGLPIDINAHANVLLFDHFLIGASFREFSTLEFLIGGHISQYFKVSYSYGHTQNITDNQNLMEASHELSVSFILVKRKTEVRSPRYF